MSSTRTAFSRFWAWTAQKRPSWREDKVEAAVLFTVFGCTGSSSVYFVRPALEKVGVVGSLKDGPNSYRVISILRCVCVCVCVCACLCVQGWADL